MKKLVVLISLMAFLSIPEMNSMIMPSGYAAGDKDTLRVLVSPELNGLVEKWVTEYSHENPGVLINVADIQEEGSHNSLNKKGVMGIVTEDYLR